MTPSDLEARAANLRETLLRLSGANQVLEEMLRDLEDPEDLVEEKD